MWTKLEGAVSAECNETVASNILKEQVQKPKKTITSFVTDLMLLVKDCNYMYIDEDRQVRDQFMYGNSDDDLKKKLLEKGNNLTRIQAVSIGKACETTNQEVQECCLKPPVSESTNAVLKDNPKQRSLCNYCANKNKSHSFANKSRCPALGAVCSLC